VIGHMKSARHQLSQTPGLVSDLGSLAPQSLLGSCIGFLLSDMRIGLWGIKFAKILKDMGKISYGLAHEISEAPAETVTGIGVILVVLVVG